MPPLIAPDAPPAFGKGAVIEPLDPRDFQIADELAALGSPEELAAAFPTSYRIPSRPPKVNQGATPQCVTYAEGQVKAWEDHRDLGWFFDPDQARQFYLIGGTSSGASPTAGLKREVAYGYPEQGGANAWRHKILAYYGVNFLDANELKAAIMAFGPVVVLLHWPASWEHLKSNGQVPAPSGVENGHLIALIGWTDGLGFLADQTWGTAWGPIGGDCYIPATYIAAKGAGAWRTVDKIEVPTTTGETFLGHYVVIEGAYTMTLYTVSASCGLTPYRAAFSRPSSAPVAKATCGSRTYWRTLAGGLTGKSYVCGVTGYGWHVVRRYRRNADGAIRDLRIACTGT
jgi:hypothetical protein